MISPRIFLLSPAHCGGKRAALLARTTAAFPLAERLRAPGGAPLGEVFAFLSGLYFRGKLAYAERFAAPPGELPGALVITTNRGLLPHSTRITTADLFDFGSVTIDPADPRYRDPLVASLHALAYEAGRQCDFVLLGSIATSKYVELLLEQLGDRLRFPAPFVGMGDMQRGALLLRAAANGTELPYLGAAGAVRTLAATRPRGNR